jgi:hypothetical protein
VSTLGSVPAPAGQQPLSSDGAAAKAPADAAGQAPPAGANSTPASATSPQQPPVQPPPAQQPPAQTNNTPAGAAPPAVPTDPGFLERGGLRRRLRFLRKTRELAYRDLGGLLFEMHRLGQQREDLVKGKLVTLERIDSELRAIEDALHERRGVTVLREAGVTACPRCAAIHGSEDRFCPACGFSMGRSERPIAANPVAAPVGTPAQSSVTAPPMAMPRPNPSPSTPAPVTPPPVAPATAPVSSEVDQPTEIVEPPTQIVRPGESPAGKSNRA